MLVLATIRYLILSNFLYSFFITPLRLLICNTTNYLDFLAWWPNSKGKIKRTIFFFFHGTILLRMICYIFFLLSLNLDILTIADPDFLGHWQIPFLDKKNAIRMSNWRHRTTEGAEFWIICKHQAFISTFSRLQFKISDPGVRWRHITSHSAYVATETELVGAKIDGLLPPNFL